MSKVCKISKDLQMCILFDVVNPVRQFKRGTVFDENSDNPFPVYTSDDEEEGNCTESDADALLQPYMPGDHTYVQSISTPLGLFRLSQDDL